MSRSNRRDDPMPVRDEVLYLDSDHPLVAVAYSRWRDMPWKDVLQEMAMLFHLAVQIEDVRALDRSNRRSSE
jgi:hypothetical protein